MNAQDLAAKINDLDLEEGIISISLCNVMGRRVHLTEQKFHEIASARVIVRNFSTTMIELAFDVDDVTFFALQKIDTAALQAALQLVMAA